MFIVCFVQFQCTVPFLISSATVFLVQYAVKSGIWLLILLPVFNQLPIFCLSWTFLSLFLLAFGVLPVVSYVSMRRENRWRKLDLIMFYLAVSFVDHTQKHGTNTLLSYDNDACHNLIDSCCSLVTGWLNIQRKLFCLLFFFCVIYYWLVGASPLMLLMGILLFLENNFRIRLHQELEITTATFKLCSLFE